MTGICRIWIPGFRLMFKLLSEATKGPEPVLCTAEQEKALIISTSLSPEFLLWVSPIEKKKNLPCT